MEKLVPRQYRKDPRHRACRDGLVTYAFLLLALFVISPVAAQQVGHPAKAVRVFSAGSTDRVSTTIAPAVALVAPVNDVAAAPVATAIATPTPVYAPTPKKARRVTLSTGPYLPMTGSLPLRFSNLRDWPPPLPGPTSNRREEDATVAVTARDAPETVEVAQGVQALPAAQDVAIAKEPAATPVAVSPAPTLLTADMVLGFLGGMPAADIERIAVRFEPAIPQRTNSASALATLSP